MWIGIIYSFHSACPGLPVATTYSVTQHQSTLHSYGEWSNFQTLESSDFSSQQRDTTSEPSERQIFERGVTNSPNSLAIRATVAGARWVV